MELVFVLSEFNKIYVFKHVQRYENVEKMHSGAAIIFIIAASPLFMQFSTKFKCQLEKRSDRYLKFFLALPMLFSIMN